MTAALKPRSMAPIFRRNPELMPVEVLSRRPPTYPSQIEIIAGALVTPLCVFAARRKTFDCIVRSPVNGIAVLNIIFRELPLAEHGWDHCEAKLELVGPSADGFPIWRVSRG